MSVHYLEKELGLELEFMKVTFTDELDILLR